MARRRATVVSQAPGAFGVPLVGHTASARSTASCRQSSASSQSPKSRMRVATTRARSVPSTDGSAPSI